MGCLIMSTFATTKSRIGGWAWFGVSFFLRNWFLFGLLRAWLHTAFSSFITHVLPQVSTVFYLEIKKFITTFAKRSIILSCLTGSDITPLTSQKHLIRYDVMNLYKISHKWSKHNILMVFLKNHKQRDDLRWLFF